MYIGNTNCKPSLLLNNVSLAVVAEVNDLGVVTDSRLSFHTDIRKNVVVASVRANLIHKCYFSFNVFVVMNKFNYASHTCFALNERNAQVTGYLLALSTRINA